MNLRQTAINFFIMNIWFYIVIMAVVQGVAEFLPVSSSGHLAVLGELFDLREDESLTLGILLHAGSLVAILTYYFKTLIAFLRPECRHLAWMVIVGTLPGGIAGVTLKATGYDRLLFSNTVAIGIAFMITATLLRLSEKSKLIVRSVSEENRPPAELENITLRQALTVGITQMFALLPGISRSGSTISAGILSGINREAAGTFSFLLAIPAVAGAVFVELLSLLKENTPETAGGATALQMLVGFLLSALVSYSALSLLTRVIKRGRLSWFSWYLYGVGILVILWQVSVMTGR